MQAVCGVAQDDPDQQPEERLQIVMDVGDTCLQNFDGHEEECSLCFVIYTLQGDHPNATYCPFLDFHSCFPFCLFLC